MEFETITTPPKPMPASEAGAAIVPTALAPQARGPSICGFWMGGMLMGLDVSLVAEVVSVESMIAVPMSPSFVLGLFNLRGTPVALMDLAEVLGFTHPTPQGPSRGPTTAIVLRYANVTVAFLVDRMHAVIASDEATRKYPGPDDHPAISSFLPLGERSGLTVTVLDSASVLKRLAEVQMRHGAAE